jgi:nucleoid-associated protein YgaU
VGPATAAEEAQQMGGAARGEGAVPRGEDPLYEAFSSLHARQQWLEGEIARLQEQLAEAAAGFASARQALRESETTVRELQGQIARLEQANRVAEEARSQLTAENAKFAAALTQERAKTEADARPAQDRLKALQQRLSDMELEGDASRARLAELEQGRDRALSANLIMQAEKRDLEGELERQERTNADLMRQIETLEVTLEARAADHEVRADKEDRLEEALAQSDRRIDDLTRELGGAQQQDRARLGQPIATESDLMARLAEQTKAAKAAQERAQKAEAMLAGLKASRAELGSQTELAASLEKSREQTADLQERLKVLEETHAGAVAAMERLQQDKARLEASLGEATKTASASTSKRSNLEGDTATRSEQSDTRIEQALERQKVLEVEKRALQREAKSLRDDLESLRRRSPAGTGDTVAPEQLKQEAAERANALRELYVKRGQIDEATWKESRARLEAELRDRQYLLAQSLSAQSVYRVTRADNLGKISRKVYGKALRWPEIFDANRHLLEDPDRLFPGMTLVIP